MAIGKYLQLFRSSTIYTSYDLAKGALDTQVANVQDGSPLIARYTEEGNQHTLLAVKGADNKAHFVELSNDTPITNKYLKSQFDALKVTVVAEVVGDTDPKVIVDATIADDGATTYTLSLENAASTGDVNSLAEKVGKIGLTKTENASVQTITFTNGEGATESFTIDKDSSLVEVKLGNGDSDETFQENATGQVLKFVYELADNTLKTVYINFGHVITDAEFTALVEDSDGLSYDGGKLNVNVDDTYVIINDDKTVTLDFTEVGNKLVEAEDSPINLAINGKIEVLDLTEVAEEGKAIVAVSQTDGKVSATAGNIKAEFVDFTKDTESQLKSTNVNAAILELEDKITEVSSEAIGIAAGDAIDIKQGEGSTTNTISVKYGGQIILGEEGKLTIAITEGAEDGHIAVNGEDVFVHGLGTAAYTDSDAYDPKDTAKNKIEALDATVSNTPGEGDIVKVEVVQVDGLITTVNVTEGDTWDCGTF